MFRPAGPHQTLLLVGAPEEVGVDRDTLPHAEAMGHVVHVEVAVVDEPLEAVVAQLARCVDDAARPAGGRAELLGHVGGRRPEAELGAVRVHDHEGSGEDERGCEAQGMAAEPSDVGAAGPRVQHRREQCGEGGDEDDAARSKGEIGHRQGDVLVVDGPGEPADEVGVGEDARTRPEAVDAEGDLGDW